MSAWVVAHAAIAWLLAGLIWTVHVVQYPLFAEVGRESFAAYHAGHTRRIGCIVVPVMIAEVVLAIALVVVPDTSVPPVGAWVGLVLLAGVWASTAFLQVPQHRRLAGGFDAAAHRRLLRGNALRTALWTARGVLAAAFLLA